MLFKNKKPKIISITATAISGQLLDGVIGLDNKGRCYMYDPKQINGDWVPYFNQKEV